MFLLSEIFSHFVATMCELNEDELAENLRKQCYPNGKEKDPKQSAETLHKLGKVYRTKSPDKQSLIQSVGLMTSALIRNPCNVSEVRKDLGEVCTHILELAGVHSGYENVSSVVTDIKQQIEAFREICDKKMNKISKIPDDADHLKLTKMQLKKIDEINDVQSFITKTYINLMQQICELCLSLLGEAPCKFAVAGMGSLAREEVTPYSDFESIILLEDETKEKPNFESNLDYFRWFSMIFQMMLVLLGETVLRFLAIPCLNNPHDKTKNWFYDEYTPCGICPDGFAPPASKNPLGRQTPTSKKPWTTELIKTVTDMAKYLESDEALKNGYHLADILMCSCFVFGEKKVFLRFSSLVSDRKGPIIFSNFSQLLMYVEQLTDDLLLHNFFLSNTTHPNPEEMDLKRVFYRGCTLFVVALGRWFGTDSSSCLQILDELLKNGFLLKEDCHKLKFTVAVCCEVRLRFYLQSNSQSDRIFQTNFLPQQPEAKYLADVVGESSLLDALVNIVLLQGTLVTFLKRRGVRQTFSLLPEGSSLRPSICVALRLHTTAVELCRKMSTNQLNMKYFEKKALFEIYIYALIEALRYAEAVRVININLKKLKRVNLLEMLFFCYEALSACYFGMDDGKRAIKFCRKSHFLIYFKLCPGQLRHNAWTDCYKCSGKYTKAMKLIDKQLHRFQSEEKASSDFYLLQAMYSKGYCLVQLKRFEEARNLFKKLIDLRRPSVPRRTRDLYLCTYEFKVVECLCGLGEYDEAFKLLKSIEDTDLLDSVVGEQWKHQVLLLKAQCLIGLQNIIEAYECYKNCHSFFSSSKHYNKKCLLVSLRGLAICKFQLLARLRTEKEQPSPLVFDHAFMKVVKESSDCTLKVLYFSELANMSLLQKDSSTAIKLYRSAFEHLNQLPKDAALSLSYIFEKATFDMLLCCRNSGMHADGLQYSRQVWSLVRQFGWTKSQTERKCLTIAGLCCFLGYTYRYSECFQALQYILPIAQELNGNAHLHEEFLHLSSLYAALHYLREEQEKLDPYCCTPSVYYKSVLDAKEAYLIELKNNQTPEI